MPWLRRWATSGPRLSSSAAPSRTTDPATSPTLRREYSFVGTPRPPGPHGKPHTPSWPEPADQSSRAPARCP
eukprot:10073305-Lingulodinium_polyedra.AAC.1